MPLNAPSSSENFEASVYRRITWRLMPYLFLCYVLAYVNRVNVGFAKLQMMQSLDLSDTVYGFGAGFFFIGYFFLEVPSNMLLKRIGARRLLGSIMIIWGIVSAVTMFTGGVISYYVLRFLLGAVEAGFFPGVILYLTFWYTDKHRARMVALLMSAVPVSGMTAGPLSGWILTHFQGVAQLGGWQWLFLICGIPSSIAGLVTLLYLTDEPSQARWLSADEKKIVLERLRQEEERKSKTGKTSHRLVDVFKSPAVWLLSVVYFGITMGNYGIGFWLPQLIKDTLSKDPVTIGWLFALPWTVTLAAMYWLGRHSDATGERRWHLALSLIVAAAAFAVSAIPGIPGVLGFMALTVATAGIVSSFTVFWALPTAILSGTAAAAGIAWINSIGNLGGWLGPYAVGLIRDWTHSMTMALLTLSGAAMAAALIALYVTRKRA
jgi:D-galactonate transporter